METLDHFEDGTYQPTQDEKTMAILAHILPIIAGFLAPLVIYLAKKDESEYVRRQAAEALNFQLSLMIYVFASVILIFVIVGIFLLMALGILAFVLAIIATVKVSEGQFFKYPLTIRFVQ